MRVVMWTVFTHVPMIVDTLITLLRVWLGIFMVVGVDMGMGVRMGVWAAPGVLMFVLVLVGVLVNVVGFVIVGHLWLLVVVSPLGTGFRVNLF